MDLISPKLIAAFMAGILIFGFAGCASNWLNANKKDRQNMATTGPDFERLRAAMVREQLQGRDVKDPLVLAAMLKVPRHEFVPLNIIRSAYEDSALPLALGQTISQPYIVGFMTQALKPAGGEKVLEIGTGSGYQAAVLAEIVSEVYSVEILPELADRARTLLTKMGYKNIHIRSGDGYEGWAEFAPFDKIMVTAAPDSVPPPLIEQLKIGGRMILPVGRFEQELIIIEKRESGLVRQSSIPVRFVPMTGKAQELAH
ncbi:MAG: pcm protein-L-isoaspartate(D-aspartate) O-methyltransferase [Acidobacteria bacterium]|jgi:protein-L-isoaspartate(D-aspartate) O-methyltransferase|nr:pcm protein-L-isoaspartate(D-aspartate) O-methyltransferase [Acidobacteriota bacterium]